MAIPIVCLSPTLDDLFSERASSCRNCKHKLCRFILGLGGPQSFLLRSQDGQTRTAWGWEGYFLVLIAARHDQSVLCLVCERVMSSLRAHVLRGQMVSQHMFVHFSMSIRLFTCEVELLMQRFTILTRVACGLTSLKHAGLDICDGYGHGRMAAPSHHVPASSDWFQSEGMCRDLIIPSAFLSRSQNSSTCSVCRVGITRPIYCGGRLRLLSRSAQM